MIILKQNFPRHLYKYLEKETNINYHVRYIYKYFKKIFITMQIDFSNSQKYIMIPNDHDFHI